MHWSGSNFTLDWSVSSGDIYLSADQAEGLLTHDCGFSSKMVEEIRILRVV
jgi:hypothetical protein